jgi:hypothetical protein
MNRNLADKIAAIMQGAINNLGQKRYKEPLNTWVKYLMQTITQSLSGGFNLLRKTVVNHCKCLIFENILEKEAKNNFDFYTW